jgi:hypothetical protein
MEIVDQKVKFLPQVSSAYRWSFDAFRGASDWRKKSGDNESITVV